MKSLEAVTLALIDSIRLKLQKGVLPPAGYSQKIGSREPIIEAAGVTWLRSGVLAPASQYPAVPEEFKLLGASGRTAITKLTGQSSNILSAASYKEKGAYCNASGHVYYSLDGGDTFTRYTPKIAFRVFECNGYFYFSGDTAWRTADFVTVENLTIPHSSSTHLAGIVCIDGNYRAVSSVNTNTDYVSDDGITFTVVTSPEEGYPTGLATNGRIVVRTVRSGYGPQVSSGTGSWKLSRLIPTYNSNISAMYNCMRVGEYVMVITSSGNFASIDGEVWEFWGSLPDTLDTTFLPYSSSGKGLLAVKLTSPAGVALTNNGRSWYIVQGTKVQQVPMIIGQNLILFEQDTVATTALRYAPTKMVGYPVFTDNTYYRVA